MTAWHGLRDHGRHDHDDHRHDPRDHDHRGHAHQHDRDGCDHDRHDHRASHDHVVMALLVMVVITDLAVKVFRLFRQASVRQQPRSTNWSRCCPHWKTHRTSHRWRNAWDPPRGETTMASRVITGVKSNSPATSLTFSTTMGAMGQAAGEEAERRKVRLGEDNVNAT